MAEDRPVELPKTPEAVEELVERFEGQTRHLTGRAGQFITAVLVIMSMYHLWSTTATVVTQIHRTIHLLFVLFLVFLLYPGWKAARARIHPIDVILSLASIVAMGWILYDFDQFIYRASIPNQIDVVLGVLTVLLVLEAT